MNTAKIINLNEIKKPTGTEKEYIETLTSIFEKLYLTEESGSGKVYKPYICAFYNVSSLNDIRLSQLQNTTVYTIIDYFTLLYKQHKSFSYMNSIRCALQAYFKTIMNYERRMDIDNPLFKENPASDQEVKDFIKSKGKKTSRGTNPFDGKSVKKEDIESVINQAKLSNNFFVVDRDVVMLQILKNTGLRENEMSNLRAKDVCVKNEKYFIHVQKGKKNKRRYVPITEEFYNYIKSYIFKYNIKSDEYVYCKEYTHNKLADRAIEDRLKFLCSKIENKITLNPHDIRRYYASNNYKNGIDIKVIQKWMGHSDVSVTWTYIMDEYKIEDEVKIICEF